MTEWNREASGGGTDVAVPLPGPRTLGRYALRYRIAQGGMASVYLAQIASHEGFRKWVAVKAVHRAPEPGSAFQRMFLHEAKLAAELQHPNICTVFDFGEEEGVYYLAMEYLHGEPLNTVVRRAWRSGALPPSLGARIVADAARGLHSAHEHTGPDGKPSEIVHRDVSPQNIFVLYDGVAKVVDFGIARSNQYSGDSTAAGAVRGKLAYLAPEQYTRERPVDRRTDVFGLGVVLWEATTGERLFRRDSVEATCMAVLLGEIARPSERRPGYPPALERVVMRALERDPDKRFATAEEMARELERFIARGGAPCGPMEVADFMRTTFADRITLRNELLRRGGDASRLPGPEDVTTTLICPEDAGFDEPEEAVSQPPSEFARPLPPRFSPPPYDDPDEPEAPTIIQTSLIDPDALDAPTIVQSSSLKSPLAVPSFPASIPRLRSVRETLPLNPTAPSRFVQPPGGPAQAPSPPASVPPSGSSPTGSAVPSRSVRPPRITLTAPAPASLSAPQGASQPPPAPSTPRPPRPPPAPPARARAMSASIPAPPTKAPSVPPPPVPVASSPPPPAAIPAPPLPRVVMPSHTPSQPTVLPSPSLWSPPPQPLPAPPPPTMGSPAPPSAPQEVRPDPQPIPIPTAPAALGLNEPAGPSELSPTPSVFVRRAPATIVLTPQPKPLKKNPVIAALAGAAVGLVLVTVFLALVTRGRAPGTASHPQAHAAVRPERPPPVVLRPPIAPPTPPPSTTPEGTPPAQPAPDERADVPAPEPTRPVPPVRVAVTQPPSPRPPVRPPTPPVRATVPPRPAQRPLQPPQPAQRPTTEPATREGPVENATGFLNLMAMPSSEVLEDGRSLGFTPFLRRRMPAGRHTFRLVPTTGEAPRTINVTIHPGETEAVSVRWNTGDNQQ